MEQELLSIDKIYSIREISEWVDAWSVERYGIECLSGGRYLDLWYCDTNVVGTEKGFELAEEEATRDHILRLILMIRNINYKLRGYDASSPCRPVDLSYTERQKLKEERQSLYDEYVKTANSDPDTDDDCDQEGKPQYKTMPRTHRIAAVSQNKEDVSKEGELNTNFILKDEPLVWKFLNSELSRCDTPCGKPIAIALQVLQENKYIDYKRKLTKILSVLNIRYPNKIGKQKNIEDYLRSTVDKNIKDCEMKDAQQRFDECKQN